MHRIGEFVRSADADLVVLPELCTTGYQFDSEEEVTRLAEPVIGGRTTAGLERIAAENACFIVAGLAEQDGASIYNTSVLIGRSGIVGKYRKIHLFLEEKRWFQPGDLGFPVWEALGIRIGMMICFDWIFPEAARTLALNGADIICHPANLVLPFCQDAMITRSIENRVFSVTANRVGSEKRGSRDRLSFTGGSQVVGPAGKRLLHLDKAEETIQIVQLDPLLARKKCITSKNDIFKDRRPAFYDQISRTIA